MKQFSLKGGALSTAAIIKFDILPVEGEDGKSVNRVRVTLADKNIILTRRQSLLLLARLGSVICEL